MHKHITLMLDLLASITTPTALSQYASMLLCEQGKASLTSEMQDAEVLCRKSDCFNQAKLITYTADEQALAKAIKAIQAETNTSTRTIHLLQLVAFTNPGVSDSIKSIVNRYTC